MMPHQIFNGRSVQETTAPTVEPITTAEAKTFLKQDETTDDSLIAQLISAARIRAEDITNRRFINATLTLYLNDFPPNGHHDEIQLPEPPLSSVTSVKYVDTDGNQQTLATTEYTVNTNSVPGQVYPAFNKDWPDTRDQRHAVEIKYVAGYGAASTDLPENVISAIYLIVGHLYENREDVVIGERAFEVPMSSRYLLQPLKIYQGR